jgi:hypothetical protein
MNRVPKRPYHRWRAGFRRPVATAAPSPASPARAGGLHDPPGTRPTQRARSRALSSFRRSSADRGGTSKPSALKTAARLTSWTIRSSVRQPPSYRPRRSLAEGLWRVESRKAYPTPTRLHGLCRGFGGGRNAGGRLIRDPAPEEAAEFEAEIYRRQAARAKATATTATPQRAEIPSLQPGDGGIAAPGRHLWRSDVSAKRQSGLGESIRAVN